MLSLLLLESESELRRLISSLASANAIFRRCRRECGQDPGLTPYWPRCRECPYSDPRFWCSPFLRRKGNLWGCPATVRRSPTKCAIIQEVEDDDGRVHVDGGLPDKGLLLIHTSGLDPPYRFLNKTAAVPLLFYFQCYTQTTWYVSTCTSIQPSVLN
jgi:hypothetical protein